LPPLRENARSYARYLFGAWRNNDRDSASDVASAEAINQLFAQKYEPVDGKNPWTLGNCPRSGDFVTCTYHHTDGRTLAMKIQDDDVELLVVGVTFSPSPTSSTSSSSTSTTTSGGSSTTSSTSTTSTTKP
jgi:hypothetical protein